jgi:ABC-type branched-subunit amino acid transport system substrate-binding protein
VRRPRATRRALLVVLAGAVVAAGGCGNTEAIRRGGTTGGTTLTVYSSLPTPGRGVSRDIVDGEKLALAQVHGRIGKYTINFSSLDETGAGSRERRRAAAEAARTAMADTQTSALIGTVDSAGARSAIPLLNESGVLHVSLGAGYAGFTEPVGPDEPARWYPAGRRTFARIVGDDRAQARALVRAAGAGRIAVEAEGDESSQALAAEVRRAAGGRLAGSPGRSGAVIYAGADPVNAAGVAESVARESPGARIVLPDEVVRAGVDGLIAGPAARATVLVSRAPTPGSTPALRAFEAAFERTYRRAPGPYAALGHAAMSTVLAALTRAAETDDAGTRRRVIDAFFAAGTQSTAVGPLTVEPDGVLAAPRFSAYRVSGGHRAYTAAG